MIEAQELTQARFEPFGHVARSGAGEAKRIRDGKVLLTRTAAQLSHDAAAHRMALDFYDVPPEPGPLRMAMAERHPHSSQLFIPVRAVRYLVVVWPERPAPGIVPAAFVAGSEDVIVYNPGVWHHGIVALDGDAVFASAMWRTDGGTDAEFCALAEPAAVSWAALS